MNTKSIGLLLLALTFVACAGTPPGSSPAPTPRAPTPGTPTPGPSTPGPSTPPANGANAGPDGRDFLSIRVTDGDAPRPLVPGTVIRLGFADGRLSASAGCNIFGATYRLDGDVLIVDGGAMTEMGCDDARFAQDDWLFGLLGARPTLTLDGNDLTLTSGTTTIELLDREVAEPDQALVGPTWTLSSIITGDAVSSVPAGVVATLVFNADGSVAVNPGCNSGGGTYLVEGDSLRFGDIVTTRMACLGPIMDVEAAVLDVLAADTVTFEIDADVLTLSAGDMGLQFTAG